MDKLEYKKALTDLRNNYIDQKKDLNEELTMILGMSFICQKKYLDYITFNLISSDNQIANTLGNLIAYKIFRKRTNRDLLDISTYYFDKYDKTNKELKRSDIELNKINNAIDFINSVNDKELEKYLSYKIN
ncbi:MAG: hypothetical protein IJ105_02060 [Bacilli bacterium]|nr:hypothetical protein [Bacilli bacterium]